MKCYFSIFFALLLVLCWFSFPVLASDVEGSSVLDPAAEPDTSSTDQMTLENISNTLDVIQSQIWIILVVGLLGYVYKFFRLFF